MKQEDILREKFGRENHFRVPESYFDDFAKRMMKQIPEDVKVDVPESKRISLFTKVKPYLYLAAMFCGLLFGVNVVRYHYLQVSDNTENVPARIAQDSYSDQYIDDFCDFSGIGSEEIYAYITDVDVNY